ncbi:MAG TPA: hypothetical protein VF426_03235 [Marmoricola sp.]
MRSRSALGALLAVILVLGSFGLAASGQAAPAKGHRATPKVVDNCSSASRRPTMVITDCWDGQEDLDHIHWKHWGAHSASGTARLWWTDEVHDGHRRVHVKFTHPARRNYQDVHGRVFTRLRITWKSHGKKHVSKSHLRKERDLSSFVYY